jgi:PAS domain S-box-containing protein
VPELLRDSPPVRWASGYLRRSLLVQLVSVYLLFVLVVLITGVAVNAKVEQRLRDDVQAADQALAQEIAEQTGQRMADALRSLPQLSGLALQVGTRDQAARDEMAREFESFMDARSDILHVSWLDPIGSVLVSVARSSSSSAPVPDNSNVVAPEFSPTSVVVDARAEDARNECTNRVNAPVYEVGIPTETTSGSGVIIAQPVDGGTTCPKDPNQDPNRYLAGIVAMSLSLDQLSTPLQAVVATQHRTLKLSVLDNNGVLVASSDTAKASGLLFNMLDELPGADRALQGSTVSQVATDAKGREWLYSAVPVPRTGWMASDAQTGWAVVAQRPASEALAVVAQLHLWLLTAALIFAIGGLVFWLLLLDRVIQPLHALAIQHQAFPGKSQSPLHERHSLPDHASALAKREDEVGGLARSVERLERDVLAQLGELRTLLETSNAVVTSLDPRAVGLTIIQEVRRLVDVQAAAVLVPNEEGVLRVLVSEGRVATYDASVRVPAEDMEFPAARALHNGRPVQMIAGRDAPFPPLSLAEGFHSMLAVPIISRHAGGVVLLVHRVEPQPFTEHELDLLLTFANYATLAWEHAVLYERSDERLREVARENERLYRRAVAETQTLSALMGSMSDGLVLTGADGRVLYANRGASAITGLPATRLEDCDIADIHAALHAAAANPERFESERARAERGETVSWLLETTRDRRSLAINLRLFDVRDVDGNVIGRGLLLRDVTREHEADRFKSTLLAAVGHELRTPLAVINGHASTLLQEDVTWTAPEQRHFLRTISDEANRLAHLVSNLLDLSRLEAGLFSLHRALWALADLITGAAGRLGAQAPALHVVLADDLPLLDVDAPRVEVVLQNLIANAVIYGDGEVRITAERQGDLALVRVSDSGPGISRDDLPHIFERFYRAPRDQQRHSGGTGLGLAICKAFVEAHGGGIWAESGPAGTTISLTLPVASMPLAPAASAPVASAPVASASPAEAVEGGEA